MTEWDTMQPRERNAWIAEHVMGWTRHEWEEDDEYSPDVAYEKIVEWRDKNGTYASGERLPHYTTSAADDYRVLVRVRETWDGCDRGDFSYALWEKILKPRLEATGWKEDYVMGGATGIVAVVDYLMVGDYSHAAYLALTENGPK